MRISSGIIDGERADGPGWLNLPKNPKKNIKKNEMIVNKKRKNQKCGDDCRHYY